MKVYPLHEYEINTLGMLQGLESSLFSVGSAFFFYALGIITELQVPPSKQSWIIMALCFVVALLSVGAGLYFRSIRKTDLQRIASESSTD